MTGGVKLLTRPAPIRDIKLQYVRTTRITAVIAVLTLPGLIINPGDTLILGFIVGCKTQGSRDRYPILAKKM